MSRNPKTVLKENAALKARLAELTKPIEREWCYLCGGCGKRYAGFKIGYEPCPDCGGSGKAR